jgi:hypothetical protein
MDITTQNNQEPIEANISTPVAKESNDNITSKPSAKPKSKITKPSNKDAENIVTRNRAKSNIVPNFEKKPQIKKDIKPVQTIGNERFGLLLSMFDKKAPNNTSNAGSNRPVGKLDSSKFNNFSGNKDQNNQNNDNDDKKFEVKDGIKNRMDNLMKSNDNKTSSTGYFDPILEKRRTHKMDEDEFEEKSEEEEDLQIGESDEEQN